MGARWQKDLARFTVVLAVLVSVSILFMGMIDTAERSQSVAATAAEPAFTTGEGAEEGATETGTSTPNASTPGVEIPGTPETPAVPAEEAPAADGNVGTTPETPATPPAASEAPQPTSP